MNNRAPVPDKIVPCRICKRPMAKSAIFSHAHARHKEEFFIYLNGHDYGFNEWEILEARKIRP